MRKEGLLRGLLKMVRKFKKFPSGKKVPTDLRLKLEREYKRISKKKRK